MHADRDIFRQHRNCMVIQQDNRSPYLVWLFAVTFAQILSRLGL